MPTTAALIPRVYEVLKTRATHLVGADDSLSPVSLVHDALVKLYTSDTNWWRDEGHFRAVATLAMRQVLTDRARRARTKKHGAGLRRVSLAQIGADRDPVDLVSLVDALDALEAARPRAANVVQYRLLGGLEMPEIAREMGVSLSTAKREWRVGQAWLQRRLWTDD